MPAIRHFAGSPALLRHPLSALNFSEEQSLNAYGRVADLINSGLDNRWRRRGGICSQRDCASLDLERRRDGWRDRLVFNFDQFRLVATDMIVAMGTLASRYLPPAARCFIGGSVPSGPRISVIRGQHRFGVLARFQGR